MKREIPILLTILCGLLVTLTFFLPQPNEARGVDATVFHATNAELLQWAQVFVAVAFLLGIANLVRLNLKQISQRHPDAPYKLLLLLSLFGFLTIGMAEINAKYLPAGITKALVPSDTLRLADGTVREGYLLVAEEGQAHVLFADEDLARPLPAGDVEVITNRSLKLWIYDKFFLPLQATMFSLLAFYVASAAFRAFRARSVESTLLLLAGAVVMLGQVPIGDELTFGYASRAQGFLMEIVNGAGQRAIIIGATLGVLATGLRIVLGIERSYLSE